MPYNFFSYNDINKCNAAINAFASKLKSFRVVSIFQLDKEGNWFWVCVWTNDIDLKTMEQGFDQEAPDRGL